MKSVSIIFSICLALVSAAKVVPAGYDVAKWYGFKNGAITYTFDDGTKNQVPIALPLLNKYGFKATFFLVTGWSPDWNGFKQAAQSGHEIGSHTVQHTGGAGENELSQSKQTIQQQIGQECVTIAYPNCVASDVNALKKYYIAGRICSGQLESSNPGNMFGLSSMIVGDTGSLQTAQALNQKADQAAASGQWAVFLIHGVDGDGGYSPVSSQALDGHFNYVKSSGKFWVGTFRDVSKYVLEANNLVITESGNTIDVSCSYQTTVTKLDHPVTISKPLSGGGNPKVTSSSGRAVQATVSNGKLIFDVIPGEKYTIQ